MRTEGGNPEEQKKKTSILTVQTGEEPGHGAGSKTGKTDDD